MLFVVAVNQHCFSCLRLRNQIESNFISILLTCCHFFTPISIGKVVFTVRKKNLTVWKLVSDNYFINCRLHLLIPTLYEKIHFFRSVSFYSVRCKSINQYYYSERLRALDAIRIPISYLYRYSCGYQQEFNYRSGCGGYFPGGIFPQGIWHIACGRSCRPTSKFPDK